MEIADLDPVLADLYDKELVFHGFTPYMSDYEMVLYEPVDPNPKYGLVLRHLRFLFRYCTESTVTSRARPDVWNLVPQQRPPQGAARLQGLDRLRLGRGGPGGLPGCHGLQGSKRTAYWADQLGTAFHEVLVEANPQTIGLVFSEATVAEVTPVICPSSLRPRVTPKPTPRASICVRTQGPSTRTGHPMGHARSGTKSRAVRQRGALRHPHR